MIDLLGSAQLVRYEPLVSLVSHSETASLRLYRMLSRV